MTRPAEQVNFKMPAELRQKLKETADASNRTLTAEIVQRLTESFEGKTKSTMTLELKLQADKRPAFEEIMAWVTEMEAEKGRPFDTVNIHMSVGRHR